MSVPIVRAHVFEEFEPFAASRGLSFDGLLAGSGLTRDDIADGDNEIPLNAAAALLNDAAYRADDTLRSQLSAAGTTFEVQLLETRQQHAQTYLRDTDLPLTEIAFSTRPFRTQRLHARGAQLVRCSHQPATIRTAQAQGRLTLGARLGACRRAKRFARARRGIRTRLVCRVARPHGHGAFTGHDREAIGWRLTPATPRTVPMAIVPPADVPAAMMPVPAPPGPMDLNDVALHLDRGPAWHAQLSRLRTGAFEEK